MQTCDLAVMFMFMSMHGLQPLIKDRFVTIFLVYKDCSRPSCSLRRSFTSCSRLPGQFVAIVFLMPFKPLVTSFKQ
jgi:hypothetical protein